MTGVDAQTGRALGGIAHLRQSVRDILTTPAGSRVLLRDYGAGLPDLVDRPANGPLLAAIQADAADALASWEPRLRLRSVRADSAEGGRVTLSIEGWLVPEGGRPVRLLERIA